MGKRKKVREQIREVTVTDEMAEVGASVMLAEPGVAPLGVFFSGADLARKVYEAMRRLEPEGKSTHPLHNFEE